MVNQYVARLEKLDEAGFMLPPTRHRFLLLTGQSCFTSSRLRPEQLSFLQEIAPPAAEVVNLGFPWHKDMDCETASPHLLAASWRNFCQWRWARRRGRFTNILERVFGLLLTSASERLSIITGSCGIHLLAAALELTPPSDISIQVLALGPVGRVPELGRLKRLEVLQGKRDYWSRALWSGPIHHRPANGHLNYFSTPENRVLAKAFFAREA